MEYSKENKNTFSAILDKLSEMTNFSIQYGIFNSPRAQVLKAHTFGSPARHLPRRDIMVRPVEKYRQELYQQFILYCKNTNLARENGFYPVYNALGRYIIDNVIKHYLESNGEGELAPLKERTIKKKGNDLILRDTFEMYKALDSRVVKKK